MYQETYTRRCRPFHTLEASVARTKLAESGLIGATNPRISLRFMQATLTYVDFQHKTKPMAHDARY